MFWNIIVSEGVKKLGETMIENYKDWEQGQYAFSNKKTGISFWTCNGPDFLYIKGQDKSYYNSAERKYLFNCILEVIRKQIDDKGYMD